MRLVTGWNTLRKNPELIAACGRLAVGRGQCSVQIRPPSGFGDALGRREGLGGGLDGRLKGAFSDDFGR